MRRWDRLWGMGIKVLGIGYWVLGIGVLSFEFWVLGFGFWYEEFNGNIK
jgi:hypothetical protein